MGMVGVPAQPLRSLFIESDRVVVATVGKSVPVERDGKSSLIKTPLAVSQTIKGDGHKPALDLIQWSYSHDQNEVKEGDTVLAFLQRKEDQGSKSVKDVYEPIYGSTSMKKLNESDLATYVRRLDQLKELTGRSKSDPKDLVEWLVQCVEDPVTRWDGAFELEVSIWREESNVEGNGPEPVPNDAAGTETIVALAANALSRKLRDAEPSFSASLTSNQRERLVNVLLKSTNIGPGTYELIEITKSWKDARLLPFLMTHLIQMENTAPTSVQGIMRFVAELLDDEKVSDLLDQYRDDASYEDLEVKGEAAADTSSDEDETEKEKRVSSDDDEAVKPKLSPDEAKLARRELLKKFIVAAQAKIKQDTAQLK